VEELLAAVRDRLAAVTAAQDPAPLFEPGAEAEAESLAAAISETEGGGHRSTEALYQLGFYHWYRSLVLAGEECLRETELATANFLPLFADPGRPVPGLPKALLPTLARHTIVIALGDIAVDLKIGLWRRVLDVTDVQDHDYPGRLVSLGFALQERSRVTAGVDDLDEAIGLIRRALDLTPPDSDLRAMYLASQTSLLTALWDRTGSSARSGAADALDEAVEIGRAAVAVVREDDPVRGAIASLYGVALLKQAARSGSTATIDELITIMRDATRSVSGERGQRLSLLASGFRAKFERTDDPAALAAAISAYRDAVDAISPDDPGRPGVQAGLSGCLRLRFARTGAVDALTEAVAVAEAAVRDATASTPDRGMCLTSLAVALLARFDRFGSVADLIRAAQAAREAATITGETAADRAIWLSNLSVTMQTLAEHTDDGKALAEAVSAARQALDLTPPADINRPARESNLLIALKDLFQRTGDRDALEEATVLGDSALSAVQRDHPARSFCLSNAATARLLRFGQAGSLSDLDAAIGLGREAVATVAPDNPDYAVYLSNLGVALYTRAERTGSTSDLEAAIRAHREAMAQIPADHPDWGRRQANLAVALKVHATKTGTDAGIDDAVSAVQSAVNAMPERHPARMVALSNLGSALRERFALTGSLDDITAAITAHSQALAAADVSRPDRGTYLTNYANVMLARGVRAESLSDVNEAIRLLESAVGTAPDDSPPAAVYLANLGNALRARAGLAGDTADQRAAIDTYSAVVKSKTAAPSVRVRAAAAIAEMLARPDPAQDADVLTTAVELLPLVAGRFLSRSDQQAALSGLSGLIADAAGLTLMNELLPEQQRSERALRLIEVGRTVIHTQALDIRGDLSELRSAHPALADRFAELRYLLDRTDGTDPTLPKGIVHADPEADLYQASQELDALLTRIRALPGFGSFAGLPAITELRSDAAQGPVVTFNVSRHRSDALLLTSSGVQVVPLPELGLDVVIEHLTAFQAALADAGSRNYALLAGAQRRLGEVLGWLWDAAAAPVLAALDIKDRPAGEAWPRVWWAPGGLLGLLPIHAAGYHGGGGSGPANAVPDRVVSSYTPTIRALRYARQKASSASILEASAPGPRSLVVAMPATPAAEGWPAPRPLPYAAEEAAELVSLLPGLVTLTGQAAGPDTITGEDALTRSEAPTRDAVFALLPECSVAHFACHGATDPEDPSLSRLLLQDHGTRPLTVASLTTIRLDRARLAYLSACRTAFQEGIRLLDEAIQLALAFQLAGFPHVIATQWEVSDPASVQVARDFYAHLASTSARTATPDIDPDRAAVALHHAVNALRTNPRYRARVSTWSAYIHVGA
jgi:tetratricopeptide (TPR) repeat protein